MAIRIARHGYRHRLDVRLIVAAVLACSTPASPQDVPADSGAAWVSASTGYASPGTANALEAWLRPAGRLVFSAGYSHVDQGGSDPAKFTNVYSLVAGLRIPVWVLRLSAAAGGGQATSPLADRQNGVRPVWNFAIDCPVSKHVALHASHVAIIGGQRPYQAETIGIAIGGVR